MAIGTTMCTFHKRSKGGSSIRQVDTIVGLKYMMIG